MSFRFLHAADLHLDTPFKGIIASDSELGARLKTASIEALDTLVDVARRERVAFVLFAGDVYDGAERGLRAQTAFLRALKRLEEADIRAFVVYGNHDPVGDDAHAIAEFPPNTTVFGHSDVQTESFEVGGSHVTVSGISYETRATTENLALRFPRPHENGFHIALLHATVNDAWDTNYSPCTLDDLKRSGYDYWALGHIHKRQVLHEAEPAVVYPGNTQGRSMKGSEQGAKGAYLVEVGIDGRPTLEFVELNSMAFAEVVIDVGEREDLMQLIDEAAETLLDTDANGDLVARLKLTGRSALYDDIIEKRSDELIEALHEATQLSREVRRVWWTDVIIGVQPLLDIERLREEDSLSGMLVRLADELRADRKAQRNVLFGDAPCAPFLDDEDAMMRLLDRARARVLNVLATDENEEER